MLARRHRLTSGADISTTLSSGKRLRLPAATASLWITGGQGCPQVGLAVGKAVGNSVVRSRVSRVIRHGIAPLIDQLPAGSWLVIRAMPGAERVNAREWTAHLANALELSLPDGLKAPQPTLPVDKSVNMSTSAGDESVG
jgi:ribonuclease P protein component